MNKESINHPDHYVSKSGMEVIDIIEEFTSDLTGVEAFDAGNAIKYILRWHKKNGLEDLKKAKWYIEDLIDIYELKEMDNKYEPLTNFCFSSRKEAEDVVSTLIEVIKLYGFATVSDLYEIVGRESSYTDSKYGWTDVLGTMTKMTECGYELILPKAMPIK